MADYYFNFPPITSLTLPQRAALNEPNSIALSGGPGTGKSFVSLWRHISNHIRTNPIKSQLLTFTTSLAYYLKASSASQNDSAALNVDSTTSWFYRSAQVRDEIIIDEAQDMPISFYEKQENNNRDIRDYSTKISYGADNRQILYPDQCTTCEELRRIFNQNIPFILDKNFRNTKQILQFAKIAFPDVFIPQNEIDSCNDGTKPQLFIINGNLEKQNNQIVDIIQQLNEDEYNIGILTPLANFSQAQYNTIQCNIFLQSIKTAI